MSRHRYVADPGSTSRPTSHRAPRTAKVTASPDKGAGATLLHPVHRTSMWLAGLALGAVLVVFMGFHPASSPAPDTPSYAAGENGFGGESAGSIMDTEVEAGQEISAAEAAKRLSELRASRGKRAAVSAVQWVNPVPSARFTSCFCQRWGTLHAGVDLAAPLGTPIGAVGDGVVLKAGPASGFGNAIYIQHENGDVTVYGHMAILEVNAGDIVKAGQEIAKVGNEGYSTGPHLHLEVHVGGIEGNKIDPVPWLAKRGVKVGP